MPIYQSTARTAILTRIRSANVAAGVPASSAELADRDLAKIALDFDRTGSLPDSDRIDLFRHRLEEYDAHVEIVGQAEVRSTIARLLAARRGRIVRPAGFPDQWAPDEIAWIDAATAGYGNLDSSAGVITTTTVAIAATGTIVLQHGPGQGRRADSLLPDYLLCVVELGQLVETVPEAIDRLDPVRPTTFISGPSATADIEMTRIKGVHGPRFLDVVVVRP